jgi:MYXO-CTERM domain-containing protein
LIRLPSVLALLGVVTCASSVFANGRFPNAQQLRSLDGETLVVAGTYGMLVTTNGGVDFAYQCESELFGKPTGSYTVDPLLELGPDGAIYSGSLHGLRVSRDRGCSFEPEPSLPRNWSFFELERPEGAESGHVVDVCRRGAGPDAPVLALVAILDDTSQAREYRLYETDARGVFGVVGEPISVSLLDFGLTLEVAPSDPDRVYVTGTLRNDPVLVVSDDGGASFRSNPLVFADPDTVLGAYLGAVSPSDPDRVYLRVARRVPGEDGLYERDDSLSVSDDGGNSVSEVLRARANLLGFAVSPDGEVVLAGYGDPRVDETLSSPAAVGLYRAGAHELVFEQVISDIDVSCLRFMNDGLYVCALERDPLGLEPTLTADFHLAFHAGSGAPSSAAELMPLLKLRNVRGPPDWTDGRTTACAAEWLNGDPAAPVPTGTCARLNACEDDTRLSEGALSCGEPGGAGGASGAASVFTNDYREGCSCRFTGNEPSGARIWLALAAVMFGLRRRRQKAPERSRGRQP